MIMVSIRVSTYSTARSTYSIRNEMERFRHETDWKRHSSKSKTSPLLLLLHNATDMCSCESVPWHSCVFFCSNWIGYYITMASNKSETKHTEKVTKRDRKIPCVWKSKNKHSLAHSRTHTNVEHDERKTPYEQLNWIISENRRMERRKNEQKNVLKAHRYTLSDEHTEQRLHISS